MSSLPPAARLRAVPAWLAPALAAGFVQLLVMATYVARFGDPGALVCASRELAGKWPYEHIRVGLSKDGFDGQYYYAIARSPWDKQDPQLVHLPHYRHVRLLYPGLAWVFSGFGDPEALLWVMPALNLLAVCGIAAIGACFAQSVGRNRWWGALAPFLLNAGNPALRNLTDPLALAAGLGLLVAWLLRWPAWSLMLFAVAALFGREQNVGLVGVVFLAAVAERDWKRAGGLVFAVAVWAAWVAHVWGMYGEPPFLGGNFGPPFAGVWYRIQHIRGDSVSAGAPIHAVGLLYLGALVLIAAAMPLFRAHPVPTLTALAGATTAVCASSWVFMDGHSYTRVFAFLPLGIFLWGLQSGRRWPLLALSPALLWPAYSVVQVWLR